MLCVWFLVMGVVMITSRADGKNCIKDSIWKVYDHRTMADNSRQFPSWYSIIKWKEGKRNLAIYLLKSNLSERDNPLQV